ncbi:efflux transporter periplasmic adaptor subunit [Novosphingobium sp. PC22D]|uniref:efflux RND transporter periplasmic adaptor subunit n=1 Tax=Novosphingobium sp. PC22D TaxID=1962403 RepID=UPI000BF23179|nr:efflux RND transporter periplasmic adaptor subunit [Novosphingobium sp. PC22D]PEQ13796.1 efflux transporter periplasmic adaptor subunit [Novosphingobium sp. PC22D]
MRKALAATAALGLLLAVPLAGCGSTEEPTETARAPAGPRLVLTPSDTVDWQDVSAEIATVDQAQVLARIPGILATLSVREGDMVRKGQAIGRIVDSQLGYQSGAYGAQAAAARAQAEQAKAELERVRFLHDNGVYAKARLEQAQAAAAAAQAQVRAAQAQQAAVGAVAGQGRVVAPATGRVLHADVPPGSPVTPGMTVAVITAGPTIVRLEMPESLADKVRIGSRVSVSRAGGGETMGRVVKLYPSVATGQVRADVEMPGIDNSLIGRRLPARVETGTRKALLVPRAFVTSRYGIDYVTVLTKDGDGAEVPVQMAAASEPGKVEILSGLSAGDTLIGPARDASGA